MTVSRETVASLSDAHGLPSAAAERLVALAEEHALPPQAPDRLAALVAALAAAPDPHTTDAAPGQAVDRHVADSLTGLRAEPLRSATAIADIGAGAGFPGLALAVALPAATVHLIESTRRKTDLIARLAAAAQLPNATPIAVRAERRPLDPDFQPYAAVTARALAPLPVLAEYAAPLLALHGHLIAYKGQPDPAEIQAAATAAATLGLTPLDPIPVHPFPGSRRTLFVYRKDSPTPDRFPRRPGMAAKRPLGSSG